MKEKYKWPVAGFLLGVVFSYVQLVLILKKYGIEGHVSFVKIWERPIGPLALGIAFFVIGVIMDRIIEQRKETKEKNGEIQKAMIDQAMKLGAELNRTMGELNRYTDHLDKIVNNIKAGVCLIDRDFIIGEGFNNAFVNMFGQKEYLGNSVFTTIFSMLGDTLKKETEEFLTLCFENTTASDSMLMDANPVAEMNYLSLEGGEAVPKIIQTRVVRLKNSEDEVDKILFLFDDVSLERRMEESIRQSEKEYNRKYSIVVSLLGNDRDVTRQFIRDLEGNMERLGSSIKMLNQGVSNPGVMGELTEMTHSIKGEAFSLGFKTLAEYASSFENYLKEKKDAVLDIEMNLEIINFYEKISSERKAFEAIIEELTVFIFGGEGAASGNDPAGVAIEKNVKKYLAMDRDQAGKLSLLEKELGTIVMRTAEEKKKQVKLDFFSDMEEMEQETYTYLKEALLHLVRNSIDHGIETPDVREQTGKPETGLISIRITKESDTMKLEYTDDGRGFDLEGIKERALEKDLVNRTDADSMSNEDIIRLIFNDGFSTRKDTDMISGMGVGMSVVRKNITHRLKGKLGVVNRGDKGVLFKISIPC